MTSFCRYRKGILSTSRPALQSTRNRRLENCTVPGIEPWEWARDILVTLGYPGLVIRVIMETVFPPIPSEPSCRWASSSS
jgi:hypothetical protein